MAAETNVIKFPKKLEFLFQESRYKVLYGGRGGAKSWGVARALLIKGMQKKLLILCTREFQNSITDSVHKLLSEQIDSMGLSSFYDIKATEIVGKNGTQFIFKGIRHNISSIKSFEGVDIVWCEEAQTISKMSWDVLIPTIRKDGSEIWLTFNPLLETDNTYQRFVLKPPANAIVKKISWQDNPYFPEVLQKEMQNLKDNDYDAYLNVWEGNCRQTLEGAIYANEIRQAVAENRITKVTIDPSKPVHTFFDMGWSDASAIWFAQAVGFEYRIIDYLEASQKTVKDLVVELQKKNYIYGTDYLPHDAAAKTQAGAGRSIEQQMRSLGRLVKIVPKLSITDGINAARTIFPQCWFDEANCADGLQHLRHYKFEVDEETGQFSKHPVHDQHSHGADAFRMLAVSLKEKKETPIKLKAAAREPVRYLGGKGNMGAGWMGN